MLRKLCLLFFATIVCATNQVRSPPLHAGSSSSQSSHSSTTKVGVTGHHSTSQEQPSKPPTTTTTTPETKHVTTTDHHSTLPQPSKSSSSSSSTTTTTTTTPETKRVPTKHHAPPSSHSDTTGFVLHPLSSLPKRKYVDDLDNECYWHQLKIICAEGVMYARCNSTDMTCSHTTHYQDYLYDANRTCVPSAGVLSCHHEWKTSKKKPVLAYTQIAYTCVGPPEGHHSCWSN